MASCSESRISRSRLEPVIYRRPRSHGVLKTFTFRIQNCFHKQKLVLCLFRAYPVNAHTYYIFSRPTRGAIRLTPTDRRRANLPFPESLPEFQGLFPDDAACASYLEKSRWSEGFVCPHCGSVGEPFRFENRPGVLRCRHCRRNTGLTVEIVMERSHTPLSVWFWAAYLVASQTQGMSAVQFQRQLG